MSVWHAVAGFVGKLLWSKAKERLSRLSDEDLRGIAREVASATMPMSVQIGYARDRIEALGVKLDDDLDERLLDILDAERMRLKIPEHLDGLAKRAASVVEEWEAAERRGLAEGRKAHEQYFERVEPARKGDSTDGED